MKKINSAFLNTQRAAMLIDNIKDGDYVAQAFSGIKTEEMFEILKGIIIIIRDNYYNFEPDNNGWLSPNSWPTDPLEAIRLMANFAGNTMVATMFGLLVRTHGLSVPAMQTELAEIRAFTNWASSLPYVDAVNCCDIERHEFGYEYAYQRIKNGYYETHLITEISCTSVLSRVYARYIMYPIVLTDQIRILTQGKRTTVLDKNFKPSVTEWALYYYYSHESGEEERFENLGITKTQAIQNIANDHGFSPQNFTNVYGEVSHPVKGKENRMKGGTRNLKILNNVAYMLGGNPKALALVTREFLLARVK